MMYTTQESGALVDRKALVENNLGLVHACAHKFKGRGIEYDDLFQAGCIGIMKASEAFDTERGVRFSTYAVPVILGEIRRLFRDGGTVKISRSLKELGLKVARVREQFTHREGREPTVGEIAELLGVDQAQVVEAIGASTPPLSLTDEDEEGGGQIDLPTESPEEMLSDLISLKQVVGLLPPEDRKLIVLRYYGGKTQTQTAEVLGMTQVQVSRREKKILTSLRQQLIG